MEILVFFYRFEKFFTLKTFLNFMLDLPQVASFPTTKNLSAHIKVRKEILTFGDIEIEKKLL